MIFENWMVVAIKRNLFEKRYAKGSKMFHEIKGDKTKNTEILTISSVF